MTSLANFPTTNRKIGSGNEMFSACPRRFGRGDRFAIRSASR